MKKRTFKMPRRAKKPPTKEEFNDLSPILLQERFSLPIIKRDQPISEILDLSTLNFPGHIIKTLSAYFSGYRDIQSLTNSFGLSFFLSLIDYSIHFNQTEKLSIIQSLFTKYPHEMSFGQAAVQENIVTQLISMIKSENPAQETLMRLQDFIEEYYNEFIYMYRNCMNIIAKLNYYSPENEMLRQVLMYEEVLQICANESSLFPQEMFLYFVEYFKVRVCLLNSSTLEVDQMGKQDYPPLYIINIKDGYCPLSTNFELTLRTMYVPSSYRSLIDFFMESEKLKNSNSTINELENNIRLEEKKFSESIEVFLRLVTREEIQNCKKSQCLDGGMREEQSNMISAIVCDYCDSVARTYLFECKHHLCAVCYYNQNYENPLRCPKCGIVCYLTENNK